MEICGNKKIISLHGREILDSRGNPTVEATVVLDDGSVGTASVPSGASTGKYEAHELRDGDGRRYGGRGVLSAVKNINEVISAALVGRCGACQSTIDEIMISLDGSENKSALGANATLAVSLAMAKATAKSYGLELYQYLGGAFCGGLPSPMFNILNGGAHAKNNVEIQEFMVVPRGFSIAEAVRAGAEIYRALGDILTRRGLSTTVGDEGGYAPNLGSDEEAIELLCRAIEESGYNTREVGIALDVASSEWYSDGRYRMPKREKEMSTKSLIDYCKNLVENYPIISIEDGLSEDDFEGWCELTRAIGEKTMLVGDDLFVTNEARLMRGMELGAANAILIKPNQIGTLTETMRVIERAKVGGYRYIISHRSGETEDTSIADIAAATNAPFIKTGAPARSERVAKYNRLMRIGQII